MSLVFHLAFPVHDLDGAYRFYVEGLGCAPGRRSNHSFIFNLGGNQIVAQLAGDFPISQQGIYPRHFGLIFSTRAEWEGLAERVRRQGWKFYQEPKLRFAGSAVEHRTFFLQDPSGNLLEFKHYSQESAIFGETEFDRVGDH